MRGTTFGVLHSNRDFHLIQQKVEITPPQPRLNIVDVPGANGGKDLTEALGVGVTFQDCKLKWTFALYPGADWAAVRARVANALNGLGCGITLDDDPGWIYIGRLSVLEYPTDGILRQITVEATCRPYKFKPEESTVKASIGPEAVGFALNIGYMPTVPQISVTTQATVSWGDTTVTVTPGTHRFPALRMSGAQTITATATEAGELTVTWREGALV